MNESLDIAGNRAAEKYGWGEQFRRLAWMSIGQFLFRCSFRTMFGWRRAVLRLFGARIGRQVNIYRSARIYLPWNLEVGAWSGIGEHVRLYNLGPIRIGSKATISPYAYLCAGTHDYEDPAMPLIKAPITVSDQVWVCADAFIGPNVQVAEGAVVGARAVVVRDVPAWTVVAGNPARAIKTRRLKGNGSQTATEGRGSE